MNSHLNKFHWCLNSWQTEMEGELDSSVHCTLLLLVRSDTHHGSCHWLNSPSEEAQIRKVHCWKIEMTGLHPGTTCFLLQLVQKVRYCWSEMETIQNCCQGVRGRTVVLLIVAHSILNETLLVTNRSCPLSLSSCLPNQNSRWLYIDRQNGFFETLKIWRVRIFISYSVFFYKQCLKRLRVFVFAF